MFLIKRKACVRNSPEYMLLEKKWQCPIQFVTIMAYNPFFHQNSFPFYPHFPPTRNSAVLYQSSVLYRVVTFKCSSLPTWFNIISLDTECN